MYRYFLIMQLDSQGLFLSCLLAAYLTYNLNFKRIEYEHTTYFNTVDGQQTNKQQKYKYERN